MSSHLSELAVDYEGVERGGYYYFPPMDPVPAVENPVVGEMTRVPGTKVDTTETLDSELASVFFGEVLFEKTYVLPVLIDAGFIIETAGYQILIWNSSFENTKTITDIQKVNDDGILLDHDPTPIEIMRNDNKIHELTITKAGPAVQQSTIIYTIDGNAYTVEVTGKRIEAWVYNPNWRAGVSMRYKFATVINRNKRYSEQRRALMDTMTREQKATFTRWFAEHEKFFHDARRLVTKILAVPIYCEFVKPSADLQGLTNIPTVTNLDDHYNLNNLSDLVLIKSKSDLFQSELKEVDTVASNLITLQGPVLGDFQQADTIIYPVFIGIIKSKSFQTPMSRAIEGNIEFREVLV